MIKKQPSSKKPRKQRKWIADAPLHKRQKMMSAHFSDELSKKYNRRSLPVRKGDTVKIMRGKYKGHVGKVLKVDLKKLRLHIEGATLKKVDGTDVPKAIHPSNVVLTGIVIEDRMRRKVLGRTVGGIEKVDEMEKKEVKEVKKTEKTESKKEKKSVKEVKE